MALERLDSWVDGAKRRSQYDVGIGYGEGIENACEVLRACTAQIFARRAQDAFYHLD